MMGIAGFCYRLIRNVVKLVGIQQSISAKHNLNPISEFHNENVVEVDDLVVRALTAVFGMDTNGRIKKEKACRVVETLGLMHCDFEYDNLSFDGFDDELNVEEVLSGLEEDRLKRMELLEQAFKVFDEDGDGFIEAVELKRVLECLGLDKGWDMSEIEKMVQVVDLNSDGKVDFDTLS
ncbi:hypothetical protein F0562_002791 [Nyssa sinensis]|uniref:EF-hand domain-containing protein n=1 Tax=Nyssa sinensis TaxID=561372 RepID=A0A5J5BWK5_9ASTE|nr:hypothetical protein F0562_002791 [Nyssa sinensis]